jgi:hypothetical protein
MADHPWANDEKAGRLVEVTCLRDESVDWACCGATMAWINSNRYVVLERAAEAAVMLVQLMGSKLHEQALHLPARIREVMTHGVHHGAAAALTTAHLHLWPEVDLHAMDPRFPSRTKVPKDVDVRWLIANFGAPPMPLRRL